MAKPEVLAALRSIVGETWVDTDQDLLRAAVTNTLGVKRALVAIARPGSVDQVRECLLAASRFRVPVYPISRGCNWGLGSRAPVVDGCILLDLGRLNAITDYDPELGTVTVEPGVTFEALHAFLAQHKAPWFAPITGSSPLASLVGNTLERGDGLGVDGDRAANVCDLEAVLSTGEVIHTGFSRFEASRVTGTHRWGLGPSLDGLFLQSNFAVITRMTLWLSRLPRSLHALRFAVKDSARLGPLVDVLRNLRAEGTLRATVGLWNSLRIHSALSRYPFTATDGATPMPQSLRDEVTHGLSDCQWHGLTGIYAADAAIGAALRDRATALLGRVVDHWSAEELTGDPCAGRELSWPSEPAFGALQGLPHEASLRSAYWRMHATPESGLDPDRDGCGVVWLCPLVSWRGEDVVRGVSLADEVLTSSGFEPMLAVISQSERSAYIVPAILFDRGIEGEADRAMRAHDELLSKFVSEGFLPYRLGVHSMTAVPASRDDTESVLRRLKSALDPAWVVSPGRYIR